MNSLEISNSEARMESRDIVELVNKFRGEEGNTTKLQHKDFMKSIRKEVEALENVGIRAERNFSLGSYIDKQNQTRPCYKLTKSATMQMLNKESAVVRYKTQLYIEKLEEKITKQVSQLTRKQELQLTILNGDDTEVMVALKEYEKLVNAPLKKELEEAKPKVIKFTEFMDEDGTFGFRDLVKHINGLEEYDFNLKETTVRQFLIEKGIICKQGKKYVVSQSGVRNGYGVVKDNIVNGINMPKTRYTDKTRDLLIENFK